MPIPDELYEQVVLHDPEGHWELECGRLRRKPEMAAEHGFVSRRLAIRLGRQLDEDQFQVAMENGRLRTPSGRYYQPDVCVIPVHLVRPKMNRSGRLEAHDEPLPFVAEVWSPSTGEYDVDTKFPEYRRRGDQEIWRLHPYERTLVAWRRQPDGRYTETLYRGGMVQLVALPGVSIDLDTLFD